LGKCWLRQWITSTTTILRRRVATSRDTEAYGPATQCHSVDGNVYSVELEADETTGQGVRKAGSQRSLHGRVVLAGSRRGESLVGLAALLSHALFDRIAQPSLPLSDPDLLLR
jgi:hypothetical protein